MYDDDAHGKREEEDGHVRKGLFACIRKSDSNACETKMYRISLIVIVSDTIVTDCDRTRPRTKI